MILIGMWIVLDILSVINYGKSLRELREAQDLLDKVNIFGAKVEAGEYDN